MGTMLSLQKVTKIYSGAGHIKAVNELSFDLEEGEICTFVGPSGCGKSTAMKMINRLISITSGKIIIDGQNIANLNTIELRRKIGYVIQNIGLFPNMTIGENIGIIPKLLGWHKSKIDEKIQSLLEIVNLAPEEFRDRYPRELSGGQQQRVGVARGMAGDPPIMLMDEPFGAIDPINRTSLQDEFLRIQEKLNKTIVFVTHDIDEAIKMGDKICLLKDGKLVQFSTPEEILTHPKNDFVSDFVGGDRTLKRLNLFTVKRAMKDNPPVILESETTETARGMFSELDIQFLITVNGDGVLTGMLKRDELLEGAKKVKESTESTNAWLPSHSSLKDGLSEIFTHEYGFLIVVDEAKKVIGWLHTEDIKKTLKG
ncbi:MAG: betaine/proline/choline family ABC transporter ATP-binding protein [Thermodesulfobacteriota bacterium]|nr:betaine/proline/choline family ABC transporter ATP-binding protein [Thermodesulfobacteriota bacterium]